METSVHGNKKSKSEGDQHAEEVEEEEVEEKSIGEGALRWRGIVQGYYGREWDEGEWNLLLDEMHKDKANFALYAPK